MAGFEHRLSGLEGDFLTGAISSDALNHEKMTQVRAQKIQNIQSVIPELEVEGPSSGDLLVLGWGGTYGSLRAAAEQARNEGKSVANAHLRYLNPFPSNLEAVLKAYKKVLIPEINSGQLSVLIRSKYLIDAQSLNKMQGQPFKVREVKEAIDKLI